MSKKYCFKAGENLAISLVIISPGSFVCISQKKTLFAEGSCVWYATNRGSNGCFVCILPRNVFKKLRKCYDLNSGLKTLTLFENTTCSCKKLKLIS